MNEQEQREPKTHQTHKENKQLEGKRIQHQVLCQQHTHKHKIKIQLHPKDTAQNELFKDILSKRDRHKDSQSKLEYRPIKKVPEETHLDKQYNKKEGSKSRSKSKGIVKSKSMKQLVKKSKSMIRLEPTKNLQKQERKSESPQLHAKSVISYVERKQLKSNFNSKTTREMISEQNTEREKSKSRLKIQKTGKKPVKVETIKKAINKSTKAKSEKENKTQKRSKTSKNKKQKKVLISEQNSKVKREVQYWQLSINEDDFLDPKNKEAKPKTKNKDNNIVDIPKRKERLSFNTVPSRKPSLKHKTEAELESYRSQKKQIQNQAAVTIQRVFRGYLTRKYIRECLLHNAAITIQKNWRGYMVRKMYKQIKSRYLPQSSLKRIANQKSKIFQQQEYLMQKSLEKSQLRNSSIINQKWTSILEEILSEQSVNFNIKKKIQTFLQSQRKELQQFNVNESRSPSVKSSISSQVINNEINSERHFFEQERIRKQKFQQPFYLNSPSNYMSPGRMQYSSPQNMLGSPQSRLVSQSPSRSSSQLLVANLKNIQKLHIDRLKSKAISEKQQLNKMLIKNKLSPRTHEKKYKEVDFNLESELQKFNESINQVVKNCIIYDQPEEILENTLVTPKKEQIQPEIPVEESPRQEQLSRPEQMSVEFRQYYQAQKQKEQPSNDSNFQVFDTSYPFIEEYLINLIDFIRQTDGGEYITKILQAIFKPNTLDVDTILKNLKPLTQGSEQEENQNSFRLPLYKFIDMQEEIIDSGLATDFNKSFIKLKQGQLGVKNGLQEIFLKMIVDCMNEALNIQRPKEFPFIQTKLTTINSVKKLKKIDMFEYEGPEDEMHFQVIFAQAMNKIFQWNKQEWGKIIRYQDQNDTINQTRTYLMKQQQLAILLLHSQQEWNFYEQLIETIGSTTEQIFEHIIFEQIAAVWNTIIEWNQKMGINVIKIDPPNSKKFYEP